MMATFIAQRVIAAAETSLANGQTKYRSYFITTTLYAAYKADVETILLTTTSIKYPNGYGDCIVTA